MQKKCSEKRHKCTAGFEHIISSVAFTSSAAMDDYYDAGPMAEEDILDEEEEMEEDCEMTHFDAVTQARLDSAVDGLLKGYNWTLAPLANK